ncbi:pteridine reductase [Dasania sp. GY-MA-18]|uniref:Pteridine reductase n=1 Tax=Dasania phycosphaerae TaxID=2950436 RepID=A0A9J6RJ75_9GAMM|nr:MULTISPECIES: pteridine reductase [Dasania]MCR8922322.1 pteridine reductase [Dasania sp. GY-MA-18]MCZ0864750.1 pteridine reductase [Dasania phycosphaerae]MCZ0868478.1 pteridine reductase [Dasania phycosphaerae]
MSTQPVAIITGGAQRIGAEICNSLHRHGYNVVIHYRHSQSKAEALCAQLNQQRSNSAIALAADLADVSALQQLIRQAQQQWGRLDALVNNASSFYPTPVAQCDENQWHDLFNSNVKGAFFLSQAAAPYLQKHKGCIVNIVDIHAQKPLKEHSLYCMAKAALAMMTQSLAKELPPVRVNGVAPGAILWPEQQGKSVLSDEDKQQITQKIPLGHSGSPQDIAKTVLFLIKDAPYITGQIISVDGGRSLGM